MTTWTVRNSQGQRERTIIHNICTIFEQSALLHPPPSYNFQFNKKLTRRRDNLLSIRETRSVAKAQRRGEHHFRPRNLIVYSYPRISQRPNNPLPPTPPTGPFGCQFNRSRKAAKNTPSDLAISLYNCIRENPRYPCSASLPSNFFTPPHRFPAIKPITTYSPYRPSRRNNTNGGGGGKGERTISGASRDNVIE